MLSQFSKQNLNWFSLARTKKKKLVQTCFWKIPQGVTSAHKGDCSEEPLYGEFLQRRVTIVSFTLVPATWNQPTRGTLPQL
jgi:hypothetical protein